MTPCPRSLRGVAPSLLLGVLVANLCACEQRLPRPPGHRVSGRVDVRGTGSAAFPVEVSIDGGETTRTSDRGEFSFAEVLPGTHVITAQAERPTLEGPVGASVTVDGANVDDVWLSLTPVGRISGRVVTRDGEPIAEARVFAAGTAAVAFSQLDGGFLLERVPLGSFTVVATRDGVSVREPAVRVSAEQSPELTLVLAGEAPLDPTRPNELPVISALRFGPKDNRGDNPRAIPAASAARPELIHPQSTLALSVEASDPDGEPLSYLWSVDKGALAGGDAPEVEWTAAASDAEVVVVVFDPRGGSATARQRFVVPKRSMRGASFYGREVIYSEERAGDSRDIVAFDLESNSERIVYEAEDEQHAPRVIGDKLVFADQVFTFVQPLVFRLRVLPLDPRAGPSLTYGQALSPDDGFFIDYRLYSPLSADRMAYQSFDATLAPLGIGVFDPATGSYATFAQLGGVGQAPAYPCLATDGSAAYGVVSGVLYRYQGGLRSVVATLPVTRCAELQVSGDFAVVRATSTFSPLIAVDLRTQSLREIGVQAQSFAMTGSALAYTDKRGGFTGVFVEDLAGGDPIAVPVRGFFDRRVLEFDGSRIVYGEQENVTSVSFYSTEALNVFTLP